MRVYVYRESVSGDETKKPPTTFCQLIEEKKYFDDDHNDYCGSDWYCEVDNVGDFLTGLQYHENEPITFRHNTDVDYYIVYIDDEDAPWG